MSERAALKELLNDYSLSSACIMVEAEALREEGEYTLAALIESYTIIGQEINRILNVGTD